MQVLKMNCFTFFSVTESLERYLSQNNVQILNAGSKSFYVYVAERVTGGREMVQYCIAVKFRIIGVKYIFTATLYFVVGVTLSWHAASLTS